MDYKIVEKSKRQKRLIKIDLITTGLYVSIIVIIGFRLYFSNYNFGYFKTIEYNWNSLGISSLEGFSPFEIGEVQQNYAGCYCESQNKVYNGTCTESQKNSNCIDIPANSVKTLYKYKAETLTIETTDSYFELLNNFDKNNKCLEGYTRCGNLDTLDQPFCTNKHCPILPIVESTDCENPEENETILTFKVGCCWRAKRLNENNTISTIMFSEKQPCLNGLETNIQFYKYPLFSFSNEKSECSFSVTYEGEKIDTNNNYKSFITVSNFSTVMNSNDLISRFKSFTSFNMSLLEIPMNFYYSTFIGYKKSCFEKYEKKTFFKEDLEYNLDNSIFGSKLFIFFFSGDILFNLIFFRS